MCIEVIAIYSFFLCLTSPFTSGYVTSRLIRRLSLYSQELCLCLSRVTFLSLTNHISLSHESSCSLSWIKFLSLPSQVSLSHKSCPSLSRVMSLSLMGHLSLSHGSSLSLSRVISLSLSRAMSLSLTSLSRIAQQVVGANANESHCISSSHVSSKRSCHVDESCRIRARRISIKRVMSRA